ncbi:orf y [Abeliophyllum distichum]|uniref:Orf y n=1 Tax=Abeliophyllum distichum TaxID=126358 RepID=A0ABD1RAT7_9LAMI
MAYSPSDREEFSIQIKELLDLKVIESSKSPFSSPPLMWTVVPFGLKQAPGIFQRHMDNIFKPFNSFCCVYIDDILIFSDNENLHEDHVIQVLNTAKTEGIVLSKKKAELFKEKIGYLGLEIAYGHKQLKPHILTHIQEFPNEIQDQKQLMRFLGCLTYAESFIKDLAKMRSPLQKKLKKDHRWNGTTNDTAYVQKIKKKIKDLLSLYHPKTGDRMIIETDASQEFWGGVLKALDSNDNIEKLCSYSSGTFTDAEKNYHINEKEILAMKKAITKFRLYIISDRFLVRTDSSTCKSFMKCQVKMTDTAEQIADIKEEIEIKKMEISVLEKKLARLEKSLGKRDDTGKKTVETSSSKEDKNKGAWTALGELPKQSKVSLNTGENAVATTEHSQVQGSQEHQGIQNPTETKTKQTA